MIRRIFFSFCALFMFCVFLRNFSDQTPLKKLIRPIDVSILTKMGFFHRGWGMFPGPTLSASSMRLRYDWKNQPSTYIEYFPLRASFAKTVWNEVMEDLGIRRDNGDKNDDLLKGFFTFECANHKDDLYGATPTFIAVERGGVPIAELYTNFGKPYRPLKYYQKNSYNCLTHEYRIEK